MEGGAGCCINTGWTRTGTGCWPAAGWTAGWTGGAIVPMGACSGCAGAGVVGCACGVVGFAAGWD